MSDLIRCINKTYRNCSNIKSDFIKETNNCFDM